MKVRAIRTGFDGLRRIREGEVFELKPPLKFSEHWMEKVEDDATAKKKESGARKPAAFSEIQKGKNDDVI